MCKKSKDCDEDSSRAKMAQRVGGGAIPIRSMRETARAVASRRSILPLPEYHFRVALVKVSVPYGFADWCIRVMSDGALP